jgi:hypothetical protein
MTGATSIRKKRGGENNKQLEGTKATYVWW